MDRSSPAGWQPPEPARAQWEQARQCIAQARHLAVLTGAGMSAESGVTTFRDAQDSYWNQLRPEEMATEAGFRRHPQVVWQWYAQRRAQVLQARPHAGHLALADWPRRQAGRHCTVITQNVDGLHQRAGSEGVLALHGELMADRWLEPARTCCDLAQATPQEPPRCPTCGNLVRPGVVWFGESLPVRALQAAEEAAQHCDVMLVVGTAGVVYPAAAVAHTARRSGAWVFVLNPQPSGLDDQAHALLQGTAAQGLPWLLAEGDRGR